MNTQVHDTTKQTPCKLVVGQSPRAIVVPDVNFRGQLEEDILKPCDREISEEVTKDKKDDDEEKKRRVKRNKSRMMKQKRMMRKEEKEEENEEIEVEDEEKEEDDEKVAKDSGNVDKDDDEEEDEDNQMEGTYVSTVASELESNIEVSHKNTSASDLPVYQYSADSEKCDGHESDPGCLNICFNLINLSGSF